jgi:hypothetical protein
MNLAGAAATGHRRENRELEARLGKSAPIITRKLTSSHADFSALFVVWSTQFRAKLPKLRQNFTLPLPFRSTRLNLTQMLHHPRGAFSKKANDPEQTNGQT